MPPRQQEPFVIDPANRTRLAWSRTAIAFAAIGGAMLKLSLAAGLVVLVLSLPIWVVSHYRRGREAAASSPHYLRLVTGTVVIVALAALVVAIFGHSPTSLGQLLHGR
jgi:uncharacterized membrane protein YidH (DUF202 family)